MLGVLATMLGLSRSTMIGLGLVLLAVLVWRKWDSIRQIYYLAKLPHPGLPWYLGGVLLPMICRRKRPLTSPEIVMPITLDWAKAHGGTYAAFLGLRPQIVTQDPAARRHYAEHFLT